MTVFWIRGLPNDDRVFARVDPRGGMQFSTGGSINMFSYASQDADAVQIFLPGGVPKNKSPSLIVNEISNPETHSRALKIAHALCEKLARPVINHPARVMQTTREKVCEVLQGTEQLVVPRVFLINPLAPRDVLSKADENDVAYPFIIRESGTHGGETMLLIRDGRDEQMMHRLRFDGRDMHLIEYVDYRDQDGLYRKYRFVMVDGTPYVRHMLISEEWMVHASARTEMEKHDDRMEQAMAALQNFNTDLKPYVLPALKEIDKKLGLDYWGVDCSIVDDGRVLVFEANCNMNVTFISRRHKELMQPYVDRIVLGFRKMVGSRLAK